MVISSKICIINERESGETVHLCPSVSIFYNINPVVAEITMLNDCKALFRQTRRSYFMMTLDFIEGEVLYELIHTLKRCK